MKTPVNESRLNQFAHSLKNAVIRAVEEFRTEFPEESPYGFAIVLGQGGDYLGYAITLRELRSNRDRRTAASSCDGI